VRSDVSIFDFLSKRKGFRLEGKTKATPTTWIAAGAEIPADVKIAAGVEDPADMDGAEMRPGEPEGPPGNARS
jgi:hypothetical protein